MREIGRQIPIIVHHECSKIYNDYRDTYWIDCVEQAKKYNDKVVLIGNKQQKSKLSDGIEFVDCDSLITNRWYEFEKIFVDMASNYEKGFSAIFFKRFFLMYEYCLRNGYDEFICLDSDLLVYYDFSKYEPFYSCDVALCMDYDQHFAGVDDKEGMRWVANAGISYYKLSSMNDFLNYIVDIYTNHIDVLQKKYLFHEINNISGGVTEMTLLYLWIVNNSNIDFLNLAIEKSGYVFNTDIWKERNYYRKEYKIGKFSKVKKIKFINDMPVFYTIDGKVVVGYNIHFGGGAKRMMRYCRKYSSIPKYELFRIAIVRFVSNIRRLMKR